MTVQNKAHLGGEGCGLGISADAVAEVELGAWFEQAKQKLGKIALLALAHTPLRTSKTDSKRHRT